MRRQKTKTLFLSTKYSILTCIFEQHIFHLLNWLDLLPLAIFNELFVNLVVGFEEIIEALQLSDAAHSLSY